MNKIQFLILNYLEKLNCISHEKFQISTDDFWKVYRAKALEKLKKQYARPRIESLNTVLFQPGLNWKTELVLKYYQSNDFVFKYKVSQYGVNKFIIIECFGDEIPLIIGCYEVPQYLGSNLGHWAIVRAIFERILQTSHYRIDPEIVIGYSLSEGIFKGLLKSLNPIQRKVEIRTSISKGSRTLVLTEQNSAGIKYPPLMSHNDDCPFNGQQIARYECLYCAQEAKYENVNRVELLTDFEIVDLLNRFVEGDLQDFKEDQKTLDTLWRELVRRGINYNILLDNNKLKLKFKVRLQNKKLHKGFRDFG